MKKSIYVKIFENRISIKCIDSGLSTEKYGSFSTSRLGIGDFDIALKLVQEGIKEIYKIPVFILPPIVIMHQIPFCETELSSVEVRVLMEIGQLSNGNPVYHWHGKELSDEEILAKKYLK